MEAAIDGGPDLILIYHTTFSCSGFPYAYIWGMCASLYDPGVEFMLEMSSVTDKPHLDLQSWYSEIFYKSVCYL